MTAEGGNIGVLCSVVRTIFAGVLILCSAMPGRAAEPESDLEYRLKAAFLLNFGKFVEWPGGARNAGKPMCYCVLGSDPFGHILETTISGKTLGDRPADVRRVKTATDAKGCQIVYIGTSERGRIDKILQTLGNEPILTVSEIPGFAERGGIINLVLKENKVHFEINAQRATKVGLQISSHLLRLASVVTTTQNAEQR